MGIALGGIALHDVATCRSHRSAQSLKIVGAKGGALATLSLKGANAALRYIDAQQGRVSSIDAIVAKGVAPSSAPIPPLPVITAIAPSDTLAKLTGAQVATMRKRATCDLSSFTGGVRESISTPETHALGGGKSLVILPCSTGAYNLIGLVFVVDGTKITPAQLDACSGFEATGADTGTSVKSVING